MIPLWHFSMSFFSFITNMANFLSDFLLDIVFPVSLTVRELQKMTINDFQQRFGGVKKIMVRALSGDIQNGDKFAADTLSDAPISFYALAPYKDPLIKELIWYIKFRGSLWATRRAGELLCEVIEKIAVPEKIASEHNDNLPQHFLIIPIPSHPSRLREKGFNQTERIARAVVACWKHSSKNSSKDLSDNKISLSFMPDVLIKTKNTGRQVHHDKKDRLNAPRDSFAVPQHKIDIIHNAHIILIDDVITTGATTFEAAKTLIAAGARQILCLAIAH